MEETWELAAVKIFISWSGPYSHEVAKIFNDWLPCVMQGVKTFLSSSDIDAGTAWNDVIRGALHECDFGLLFVTEQNVHRPWLLFEAGALAKNVSDSRVIPVFIDVDEEAFALSGSPLINLNRVYFSEEGVRKILISINNRLDANRLDSATLSRVFDKWWEELSSSFNELEKPQNADAPEDLSNKDRLSRIETALTSMVGRLSRMQSYQSEFERSNNPSFNMLSNSANLNKMKFKQGNKIVKDLLHAESDFEIRGAIRDFLNNRDVVSLKQGKEIERMLMNNFSVQYDEVIDDDK